MRCFTHERQLLTGEPKKVQGCQIWANWPTPSYLPESKIMEVSQWNPKFFIFNFRQSEPICNPVRQGRLTVQIWDRSPNSFSIEFEEIDEFLSEENVTNSGKNNSFRFWFIFFTKIGENWRELPKFVTILKKINLFSYMPNFSPFFCENFGDLNLILNFHQMHQKNF